MSKEKTYIMRPVGTEEGTNLTVYKFEEFTGKLNQLVEPQQVYSEPTTTLEVNESDLPKKRRHHRNTYTTTRDYSSVVGKNIRIKSTEGFCFIAGSDQLSTELIRSQERMKYHTRLAEMQVEIRKFKMMNKKHEIDHD